MATPWDRSAAAYLDEWVPRFVPYHLDLVNELSLGDGDRVLVSCAGPGQEVLAAARAVGSKGHVRAVDRDEALVKVCAEQIGKAGFAQVECVRGETSDVSGGPFDAIICAFGLWTIGSGSRDALGPKSSERALVLDAWRGALGKEGKVGVLTWGPMEEGPIASFVAAMREIEPAITVPSDHLDSTRESLASMFESSGLTLVRHTVLRHTLSFPNGEAFVVAMSQGNGWRKIWDELGEARMRKVAAKFYESLEKQPGGPSGPVSFAPAATLAIATLPGAQVQLSARSSMRVPAADPIPGS